MIANQFEILDMTVLGLDWRNGVLTVLRDDDHLLRRFGQIDIVNVETGKKLEILRRQADEIWVLLTGLASIQMEDHRSDSPSYGARVELELNDKNPKAILVPFGVKCLITASGKAAFVRISTHREHTDPEDQALVI